MSRHSKVSVGGAHAGKWYVMNMHHEGVSSSAASYIAVRISVKVEKLITDL